MYEGFFIIFVPEFLHYIQKRYSEKIHGLYVAVGAFIHCLSKQIYISENSKLSGYYLVLFRINL